MVWKAKTKMEQKVEFIHEWLTQKYTITEFCKSFNISRPTAYKMISRYEKIRLSGLIEKERASIKHPNRTNFKIEGLILKAGFCLLQKDITRRISNLSSKSLRRFSEYGNPKKIHTDNRNPFGSVSAIQRFIWLSYWFIELGIEPAYSDPARPDQNGCHERMHCDLKAACAKPSSFNLKAQQRNLDWFVKEYNLLVLMYL